MPSGTPCFCAARSISRSQALSAADAPAALDIKIAAQTMGSTALLIMAGPDAGLKIGSLAAGSSLSAGRPGIGLRRPGLGLGLCLSREAGGRGRRRRRSIGLADPHRHGVDLEAGI